jgi:hypothetical protein
MRENVLSGAGLLHQSRSGRKAMIKFTGNAEFSD